MDGKENIVYVAVVNLLDLGGKDDIERQRNQLDKIINRGYSLIAVFDMYPELHEMTEGLKKYSVAEHGKMMLLYNRTIHGTHAALYHGTHVSEFIKVKCNGFNVIMYYDS